MSKETKGKQEESSGGIITAIINLIKKLVKK